MCPRREVSVAPNRTRSPGRVAVSDGKGTLFWVFSFRERRAAVQHLAFLTDSGPFGDSKLSHFPAKRTKLARTTRHNTSVTMARRELTTRDRQCRRPRETEADRKRPKAQGCTTRDSRLTGANGGPRLLMFLPPISPVDDFPDAGNRLLPSSSRF